MMTTPSQSTKRWCHSHGTTSTAGRCESSSSLAACSSLPRARSLAYWCGGGGERRDSSKRWRNERQRRQRRVRTVCSEMRMRRTSSLSPLPLTRHSSTPTRDSFAISVDPSAVPRFASLDCPQSAVCRHCLLLRQHHHTRSFHRWAGLTERWPPQSAGCEGEERQTTAAWRRC